MPGIDHPFWTKYQVDHQETWLPTLMVYVIYIIYICTEVFVFIILVNFFIAMVGQVYEETMARSDI
jgi:hypothetical protein